jgi:hypothetical protein
MKMITWNESSIASSTWPWLNFFFQIKTRKDIDNGHKVTISIFPFNELRSRSITNRERESKGTLEDRGRVRRHSWRERVSPLLCTRVRESTHCEGKSGQNLVLTAGGEASGSGWYRGKAYLLKGKGKSVSHKSFIGGRKITVGPGLIRTHTHFVLS